MKKKSLTKAQRLTLEHKEDEKGFYASLVSQLFKERRNLILKGHSMSEATKGLSENVEKLAPLVECPKEFKGSMKRAVTTTNKRRVKIVKKILKELESEICY